MRTASSTSSPISTPPFRSCAPRHIDAFERRRKAMRETAAESTQLGAIYRDIGVPGANPLADETYAEYKEKLTTSR